MNGRFSDEVYRPKGNGCREPMITRVSFKDKSPVTEQDQTHVPKCGVSIEKWVALRFLSHQVNPGAKGAIPIRDTDRVGRWLHWPLYPLSSFLLRSVAASDNWGLHLFLGQRRQR